MVEVCQVPGSRGSCKVLLIELVLKLFHLCFFTGPRLGEEIKLGKSPVTNSGEPKKVTKGAVLAKKKGS